ncbi:MAG: hypothetical protein IJ466_02460 [Clostridia bacterium]|nr:hypothetical protein [Clostridia bacterium]
MREIVLKEAVELRLPAQQNMMLVLRLTTAGVIARAGLTVDRLDDVKLAVEEACSCLIDSEHAPQRLCLRFEDKGDCLLICVCGDGECGDTAVSEDEMTVVRCILESLVDGVEIRMKGESVAALELKIALDQ